jgi:hypothetical protein
MKLAKSSRPHFQSLVTCDFSIAVDVVLNPKFFLVLLFFEHESSLVFWTPSALFFPTCQFRLHCPATHTDTKSPIMSTILLRLMSPVLENCAPEKNVLAPCHIFVSQIWLQDRATPTNTQPVIK